VHPVSQEPLHIVAPTPSDALWSALAAAE